MFLTNCNLISECDIDLDDINFEKRPYSALDAYSRSKVANVLYPKALSVQLKVHNRIIYKYIINTNVTKKM